ncbi:MAG: class II aldolase/adducin family protein [Methylococcales bacterium]
MKTITYHLEKISKYAGIRFDLVQAGGGNSSVKLNSEEMLVKASGINLSEVTETSGHVKVQYKNTREWFKNDHLSGLNKQQRELKGKELLTSVTLTDLKPSIETFLHALLNTYTLHTHPISVNTIASQANWKEVFSNQFPDSVCVEYATPGIDLALSLVNEIKNSQALPKIVFLQNHGLIISSDNPDEVIELTDSVTTKLNKLVGLDLDRYQNVSKIQSIIDANTNTSSMIYCSDDAIIKQLISIESSAEVIWPFCPDTLIYCGIAPVYMKSFEDIKSITDYIGKYSESPKVVIVNDQVYFVSMSLKKARESEDLLKFHLLTISKSDKPINRLSMEEISYLSNWDAEKYRQGV